MTGLGARSHDDDVNVKVLLRIAVVHNVPIACNRSTADCLVAGETRA